MVVGFMDGLGWELEVVETQQKLSPRVQSREGCVVSVDIGGEDFLEEGVWRKEGVMKAIVGLQIEGEGGAFGGFGVEGDVLAKDKEGQGFEKKEVEAGGG